MVGFPTLLEPVNAPLGAQRRTPAIVADKPELPAADCAAFGLAVMGALEVCAHFGLLDALVDGFPRHLVPHSAAPREKREVGDSIA